MPRRTADIAEATRRILADNKHAELLRRFREIDQVYPASATYFVAPSPQLESAIDKLRRSSAFCLHGKMSFERCSRCNRSATQYKPSVSR